MRAAATCAVVLATLSITNAYAQAPTASPGVRYDRLLIRNALVIDGVGNPTRGPYDVLIEGSRIAEMRRHDPQRSVEADRIIDASGMYLMPGIVDLHGHIMFSRNREPLPKDYVYKLWLAHGITTIRDPGSGEGIDTIVQHARLSAENSLAAPTIVPYAVPRGSTPEEARQSVRTLHAKGARGLKVFVLDPRVSASGPSSTGTVSPTPRFPGLSTSRPTTTTTTSSTDSAGRVISGGKPIPPCCPRPSTPCWRTT
jgi:cytosine/adenosine deaminase-related metal-dependent hydrolase